MPSATLSSRAIGWLLGIAGVAALAGGGVLGMRLGEAASRPSVREIRVTDPAAMTSAIGIETLSPAGFTGFGGPPALEGGVLRRGIATDVHPGAFALMDGSARSQIEFTQALRLYRLTATVAPLASGDSVIVRVEDGRALGVLRVRLPASGQVPSR